MDIISLDGKRYIKAADAARSTGYTADYVGQLCRAGKIDSRLVGRTWYVHEDALGSHKRQKTRSNKKKTLQSFSDKLAAENVGELSLRGDTRNADMPAYRKRLLESKITYLPDDAEEIPYIKQAELEVEESNSKTPKDIDAKKVAVHIDKESKSKEISFEGVHKKAALSGNLEVTDADLEEEERESTEEAAPTRATERKVLINGGQKATKSSFQRRLEKIEGENREDTAAVGKTKDSNISSKSLGIATNAESRTDTQLHPIDTTGSNFRAKKARGLKYSPKGSRNKQSQSLALLLDSAPTTIAVLAAILFVGSVALQTVWVYDQGLHEGNIESSLEVAAVLTSLGITK